MDNARKIDKLKSLQVRMDESAKLLDRLRLFEGYAVEIHVSEGYKLKQIISTPVLSQIIIDQNKLDKAEYQTILSELYNQTGVN